MDFKKVISQSIDVQMSDCPSGIWYRGLTPASWIVVYFLEIWSYTTVGL